MGITVWVSSGDRPNPSFLLTARWLKYDCAISSIIWDMMSSCMRSTVQSSMSTLPWGMLTSSPEKRLKNKVTRHGTCLTILSSTQTNQASPLAVRISSFIKGELEVPINCVTFWTDVVTVLQYIRNETRRFHRFVATRLEEIQEQTTPEQWCHVPGTLNPADDGSRQLPIEAFQPGCR